LINYLLYGLFISANGIVLTMLTENDHLFPRHIIGSDVVEGIANDDFNTPENQFSVKFELPTPDKDLHFDVYGDIGEFIMNETPIIGDISNVNSQVDSTSDSELELIIDENFNVDFKSSFPNNNNNDNIGIASDMDIDTSESSSSENKKLPLVFPSASTTEVKQQTETKKKKRKLNRKRKFSRTIRANPDPKKNQKEKEENEQEPSSKKSKQIEIRCTRTTVNVNIKTSAEVEGENENDHQSIDRDSFHPGYFPPTHPSLNPLPKLEGQLLNPVGSGKNEDKNNDSNGDVETLETIEKEIKDRKEEFKLQPRYSKTFCDLPISQIKTRSKIFSKRALNTIISTVSDADTDADTDTDTVSTSILTSTSSTSSSTSTSTSHKLTSILKSIWNKSYDLVENTKNRGAKFEIGELVVTRRRGLGIVISKVINKTTTTDATNGTNTNETTTTTTTTSEPKIEIGENKKNKPPKYDSSFLNQKHLVFDFMKHELFICKKRSLHQISMHSNMCDYFQLHGFIGPFSLDMTIINANETTALHLKDGNANFLLTPENLDHASNQKLQRLVDKHLIPYVKQFDILKNMTSTPPPSESSGRPDGSNGTQPHIDIRIYFICLVFREQTCKMDESLRSLFIELFQNKPTRQKHSPEEIELIIKKINQQNFYKLRDKSVVKIKTMPPRPKIQSVPLPPLVPPLPPLLRSAALDSKGDVPVHSHELRPKTKGLPRSTNFKTYDNFNPSPTISMQSSEMLKVCKLIDVTKLTDNSQQTFSFQDLLEIATRKYNTSTSSIFQWLQQRDQTPFATTRVFWYPVECVDKRNCHVPCHFSPVFSKLDWFTHSDTRGGLVIQTSIIVDLIPRWIKIIDDDYKLCQEKYQVLKKSANGNGKEKTQQDPDPDWNPHDQTQNVKNPKSGQTTQTEKTEKTTQINQWDEKKDMQPTLIIVSDKEPVYWERWKIKLSNTFGDGARWGDSVDIITLVQTTIPFKPNSNTVLESKIVEMEDEHFETEMRMIKRWTLRSPNTKDIELNVREPFGGFRNNHPPRVILLKESEFIKLESYKLFRFKFCFKRIIFDRIESQAIIERVLQHTYCNRRWIVFTSDCLAKMLMPPAGENGATFRWMLFRRWKPFIQFIGYVLQIPEFSTTVSRLNALSTRYEAMALFILFRNLVLRL